MSTLSAFPFIGEQSFATPGAINSPLSIISANIAAINADVGAVSGVTISPPSGNTIQMPSDLSISGYLSVGKGVSIGTQAPGTPEPVALTININSGISDYIYLNDTSNLRSDYLIGSHAGGTPDGLNIFDVSGNTMLVSFSKQSIRFYQNVVGPVFDVGGALADTLNAATFGTGTDSKEARIQFAISAATNAVPVVSRVYIPANMYPYSAASVSFDSRVQMVREGGNWGDYDAKAYGASINGIASDTSAIQAAVNGAGKAAGQVFIPPGTALHDVIYVPSNVVIRGAGIDVTTCKMITGAAGDALFLNTSYVTSPGIESSWTPRETGITIRDLTIDGNKTNVSNRYGIHFFPCSYINVVGVKITNTGLQGIKLTGCIHARVDKCIASNTSLDGIHLVHTTDFLVTGCAVLSTGDFGIEISSGEMRTVIPPVLYGGDGSVTGNVVTAATNAGILLRGLVDGTLNPNNYPLKRVIVAGNTITGAGTGIQVQELARQCSIAANICSANTTGIKALPTGFPTANDLEIADNLVTLNTGNGVFLSAFYESSCVGNHITHNGGHGLTGSIYQSTIAGNTIRNNNTAAAATTYNLDVFATSQDAEIRDNILADLGARTATADVRMATGQTRVRFVGNAVATATGPCGDLPVTLTDAATVTPDASIGNPVSYVLTATAGVGATRAIGVPTSPQPGERLVLTFIQDATGGRVLTWNAIFKNVWSDAGNTANKRTSMAHVYDGTSWNQDGAQTPYV